VTSTTARDRAYVGFRTVYFRPFLKQWRDRDTVVEMLEIVSDAILVSAKDVSHITRASVVGKRPVAGIASRRGQWRWANR
jgi:hypothetical protein